MGILGWIFLVVYIPLSMFVMSLCAFGFMHRWLIDRNENFGVTYTPQILDEVMTLQAQVEELQNATKPTVH